MKHVPLMKLLLFSSLLLGAHTKQQRSKFIKSSIHHHHHQRITEKRLNKTDVNLCDIRGNSEHIHCVCSEGISPFNKTRAECWIFTEIGPENGIWNLFSTQPWIRWLKIMVRPDVRTFRLPKLIFTHLIRLEFISILYGNIEELPSYAFLESDTLKEIALSNNGIVRLAAHCFFNMSNLISLQLDDNNIEEIKEDMFFKLPSLVKLVLSRNNLSSIQDGAFSELVNLEELHLDSNNLRTLNRMTFMELGHLKMLMLGNNKIGSVDDLTFEQLWDVVVLDLDQNELRYLSDRAFSGLNSLEELILSNNFLTVLPHGLFADNTRIKYLNLRNNELKTLSYETIGPVLTNIVKHSNGDLVLSENKLVCDCRLNWIITMFNETQWESIRNILQDLTCQQTVQSFTQIGSTFSTTPGPLSSDVLQLDDPSNEEGRTVFQDIHTMIFVGFGFLMTFLKRYGFSAVGFNFFLGAFMLQWAILCRGFYQLDEDNKIRVNIESLFNADISTGAVLISMGAVLGFTNHSQLLVMGLIEISVYCFNLYLNESIFKATDAGGSVFVHAFGAYFGLGVSATLGRRQTMDDKFEGSRYTSDLFAMIGTLFLWIYWPSFNAVSLGGDQQSRAVINTYLSLASCCVTSFLVTSLLTPERKLNMVHIQNSTLAGGVAIGTSANLLVQPSGCILIGMVAGIISVIGYAKLTPWTNVRLKIHDTCGVHNLHGMPGILGGLIGAFMASVATEENYSGNLRDIFPAMSLEKTNTNSTNVAGRNPIVQAGFQMISLLVTVSISAVAGGLTGLLLSAKRLNPTKRHQFFDDNPHWHFSETEVQPNTVKGKSKSQLTLFKPNIGE